MSAALCKFQLIEIIIIHGDLNSMDENDVSWLRREVWGCMYLSDSVVASYVEQEDEKDFAAHSGWRRRVRGEWTEK
jgi:hypothetical protein